MFYPSVVRGNLGRSRSNEELSRSWAARFGGEGDFSNGCVGGSDSSACGRSQNDLNDENVGICHGQKDVQVEIDGNLKYGNISHTNTQVTDGPDSPDRKRIKKKKDFHDAHMPGEKHTLRLFAQGIPVSKLGSKPGTYGYYFSPKILMNIFFLKKNLSTWQVNLLLEKILGGKLNLLHIRLNGSLKMRTGFPIPNS